MQDLSTFREQHRHIAMEASGKKLYVQNGCKQLLAITLSSYYVIFTFYIVLFHQNHRKCNNALQ